MEKEFEEKKKNLGIGQGQVMPNNTMMGPFSMNYGYIPAYPMQPGFLQNPYQVNQNPAYFQQNHANFQNPYQQNFYPMGVQMPFPIPGMPMMPQFIPNQQIPSYNRVSSQQIQGRKEEKVKEEPGMDYVKKNKRMKTYRKKKNIGKSVEVRQVPEKKVQKKRLGEERLCTSGLLNPHFTSQDEVDKWLRARRKNFPTRKNIEEKKRRKERGEDEGELDEDELSKLEFKLRKKIMILTSDPREERRRKKEMRFLFKNLTCIKKRKPIKKDQGKKKGKEKRVKKKLVIEPKGKEEKSGDGKEAEESESDDRAPIEVSAKEVAKEKNELSDGEIQLNLEIEQPVQAEAQKKEAKVETPLAEDTEAKAKQAKDQKEKEQKEAKSKRKKHTSDEMILHLLKKREEEENLIQNFLTQKSSSNRFRYQQNTLLTSLLLDQVHNERSLMLKTLRYIKEHNFLQKN